MQSEYVTFAQTDPLSTSSLSLLLSTSSDFVSSVSVGEEDDEAAVVWIWNRVSTEVARYTF